MPTYEAKSPVRANGQRYAVGARIEMKEADAQPLLDLGRVEKVEADNGGSGGKGKGGGQKSGGSAES